MAEWLTTLLIGGVVVKVNSDIPITFLRGCPFEVQEEGSIQGHLTLTFRDLAAWDVPEAPLVPEEILRLESAGGFQRRWVHYGALENPAVVRALRACTGAPEMCDIEFAWYRALICNYKDCWSTVFYPETRRETITGPLFLAGFRNVIKGFYPIFDAILQHAAGVVLGGRVALLVAPDGGGKTTAVRSVPASQVLSDDHVVLRPHAGGGVEVSSTPFGAITYGPASAPLGAVFLLNKALRPAVRPATITTTLRWLLDGQDIRWLTSPPVVRALAFNLLVDICRSVPLFELDVPRDFKDWDLVYRNMNSMCGVVG